MINQFGGVPGAASGEARGCLPFEAMLTDAIDGTLSAEEQIRFDEHLAECASCRAMLEDAQQGAGWLAMLRSSPPEPSAELLDRILARTSVLQAQEAETSRAERRKASEAALLLGRPMVGAATVLPVAGAEIGVGRVLPFRSRLQARLHVARVTVLQPRFAMTAAMAFFSIALTMNLTGVRLSGFRMSDLRPSNMKRSAYETRARMVRYYANLRVVYELESRVRDLQRSNESDAAPEHASPAKPEAAPATKPAEGSPEQKPLKSRPKPNSGTSQWHKPAGAVRPADDRVFSGDSTTATVVPVLLEHAAAPSQERGSV